jgi:hypothetical protein
LGAVVGEEEEEEEEREPEGLCYTRLLAAQSDYGWKRSAAAKNLSLTPFSLHGCCKDNDWMCGQPMGALNDAKRSWANSRNSDGFLQSNVREKQHVKRWEDAYASIRKLGGSLDATKAKAKSDTFGELDPIDEIPLGFPSADVAKIRKAIKHSRRRLRANNLPSEDLIEAGGLFPHHAGKMKGRCNFDIPIMLNGAGFGSAIQNVVNVVLLALHTGNSFGFCVNKRAEDIFTPYFEPLARSCPIADCVQDLGLENEGAVAQLSFSYQELSRGLGAILACGNVVSLAHN